MDFKFHLFVTVLCRFYRKICHAVLIKTYCVSIVESTNQLIISKSYRHWQSGEVSLFWGYTCIVKRLANNNSIGELFVFKTLGIDKTLGWYSDCISTILSYCLRCREGDNATVYCGSQLIGVCAISHADVSSILNLHRRAKSQGKFVKRLDNTSIGYVCGGLKNIRGNCIMHLNLTDFRRGIDIFECNFVIALIFAIIPIVISIIKSALSFVQKRKVANHRVVAKTNTLDSSVV